MDRVTLARRRRLRIFLLVVVAPAIAIIPVALADAESAPEGPTIVFTGTSTEPLVCGTRPSVTSIQIKTGMKIIIANQTTVPTAAQVNGEAVLNLEPGAGAVLRLKKGQHELRLIPDCVVVTETAGVAVTVVPGSAADETAASTPAPPGVLSTPVNPGTSSGDAAADQPANGHPAANSTSTATTRPTASASADATAGSVGGTTPPVPVVIAADESQVNGARESAVIEVRPITFGDTTDPKRGRLLAVIAAICVFGVTAAIIRAIVSQRTSNAVLL